MDAILGPSELIVSDTVQMQYAAGPHRIASWAHIINAHIFPGPAIIKALHESANSAVAANNSTIRTEITGGDVNGYFSSENSSAPPGEDTRPSKTEHPANRKESLVSISTTISTSTEYMSPPLTAGGDSQRTNSDFNTMVPPLARGLLILAQMSSKDNLFTEVYTQRCLEMAREDPSFVLGFIAQEALNKEPDDNFIVMTPGVNMPPSTEASRSNSPSASRLKSSMSRQIPIGGGVKGDSLGQQYNTPRKVIVEKGVDIVIVGRGLYKADDAASEAERYRKEAWSAYLERVNGKS